MNLNRQPSRSAPTCLLSSLGTEASRSALFDAARRLSDTELSGLEDDLKLFDETGFVGVYMSRLLSRLHQIVPPTATYEFDEPSYERVAQRSAVLG